MRVCVPGRGRVSPCAEFNFFNDPEAAFIVLASMSNIRLLPYEVCCRHNLSWVKNCLHKFCFISTLQMLGYFFVLCFPTYIKWKAKASVCCCLLLFTFIWHHSALSSKLTALVACDSKWVTCHLTCYMAGATCNCCHLGAHSAYIIQPCTSLKRHVMQHHACTVPVCLAVTCHPHFWQNDQDLLCATAVLWGRNGVLNESQHKKLTLEKKLLLPLLFGIKSNALQLCYLCSPQNLTYLLQMSVFDVDAYDADICHEDIWILRFNTQ